MTMFYKMNIGIILRWLLLSLICNSDKRTGKICTSFSRFRWYEGNLRRIFRTQLCIIWAAKPNFFSFILKWFILISKKRLTINSVHFIICDLAKRSISRDKFIIWVFLCSLLWLNNWKIYFVCTPIIWLSVKSWYKYTFKLFELHFICKYNFYGIKVLDFILNNWILEWENYEFIRVILHMATLSNVYTFSASWTLLVLAYVNHALVSQDLSHETNVS